MHVWQIASVRVYMRVMLVMFMFFSFLSTQCPAVFLAVQRCKIGLRGLGTFPPYKQGQINTVSVEGATLHMKVSWLSSTSSRREGAREGCGDGNDCFTSGKMHGGVENPLWTLRYTPSQSSGGGAGWRGEESAHIHAWLVNTIGCSLLCCECNQALLVSLFLTHTCALSIYCNTVVWQVQI